jgi:uncharacterized membrane protein
MLIMDLLIPLLMLGFGAYSSKRAPKEINYLFGYRTEMSMKNNDTWVFAHKYCGRVWLKVGRIMLPVSLIIMLLLIGRAESIIGIFGGVLCIAQLLVLMLSIIPTEKALRRTFDKNGNRRA